MWYVKENLENSKYEIYLQIHIRHLFICYISDRMLLWNIEYSSIKTNQGFRLRYPIESWDSNKATCFFSKLNALCIKIFRFWDALA